MYFKELHLYISNLNDQQKFYENLDIPTKRIDDKTLVVKSTKTVLFFHQTKSPNIYHYCWLVTREEFGGFLKKIKNKKIDVLSFEKEIVFHFG